MTIMSRVLMCAPSYFIFPDRYVRTNLKQNLALLDMPNCWASCKILTHPHCVICSCWPIRPSQFVVVVVVVRHRSSVTQMADVHPG